MRIKRFNEKEQIDISSERVEEIVDELRKLSSKVENGSNAAGSFINEFNNYKSDSQKGNDQIDDTIFALEVVKKNLDGLMKLEFENDTLKSTYYLVANEI